MHEWYYDVVDIDRDVVIAKHMSLENALIFVKALMSEYFADPNLEYAIRREKKEVITLED